jgi:peptidoglycan hydrolase-like protein with peptidoglycan-binding domain
LDLDVFYGDRAAWGRYAAKNGAGAPTPAPTPGPQPTAVTDITGIQRAVHVTADSIAGPLTRTAVSLVAQASTWGGVRFPNGVAATQHAVGTSADGVWGDNSRAAHDRTVIAIQQALRALGYAIAVDGIWGDHTEAAVTDALNRAEQP